MSKRSTSRGQRATRMLTQRGYTREGALLRALRRQRAAASAPDMARRRFLERLGVAGATLGAPALLAGCAGDDGDTGGGGANPGPAAGTQPRTLFFNLSHLGGADTTHYLHAGGRKHRLVKVDDAPHVLSAARQSNAFLREVPDHQITHHVEGAPFATGVVTLAYLTCNEQPDAGTWELTSMFVHIPPDAVSRAHARASAAAQGGPLPLSGKRRAYGVRAAVTEQDLRDEHALVDSGSHAEALVGLHPDLLSLDPDGAAHVHVNYVSQDANTQFLGGLLQTMGPAAPQGTRSVNGAPSWATLRPLVDDTKTPAVPYKKSDGKLNQYWPDWDPRIDQNVAPAVGGLVPQLKNDESLGADLTGVAPPGAPIQALRGKLWHRSDGVATVLRGAAAAQADSAPKFDFQHKNFDWGLGIPTPVTTQLGDGRIQVELDNIFNWFLRFLGMYVRFYDANGNVIPAANLPADTIPGQQGVQSALGKTNALFLGVLPPPYTLFGIPVGPGFVSEKFNIPLGASQATVILGGMGFNGSDPFADDPDNYVEVGGLMTFFVNFVLVGFLMAVGATEIDAAIKTVSSIAAALVSELVAALSAVLDWRTINAASIIGLIGRFLQVVLNVLATKGLVALATALATIGTVSEVVDSIPIAGQIARALAAVVGVVTLAETAIEVGLSPPVYQYDGTLTHDLAVRILPDASNRQFPQPSAGYTLYYKTSYLFDNGTAHVQDAVDVPDPTVQSIAVRFPGVPRGGQVDISVGFYMRKSTTPAGQNDWCAGTGTTGLFSNTVDQAPDIAIQQVRTPIQGGTQYLHTRKTALDAQGRHFWDSSAGRPAYQPPPDGQQPGLGDFRSITVRQATSNPRREGYVGYAWKAFSSGVASCTGGSSGQLDQMANLNTDAGNGGANAQDGYVAGRCGLQAGVRLGYSVLTHDAQNFYLDSSSLHIRQVRLDPPAFDDPGGGRSFGRLNLDSTRLLLHPAGHVVSISNENHKLETLRLPGAALADADAARKYRARASSGQGGRPGLMDSPTAAAISPDGAILVLEGSDGNNRIQAFDLGGNPLQFFKGQTKPYFLQLDATAGAQYLDLAVEFTGYLYVLSKDAGNRHRLDIYHPSQSDTRPICTTFDVDAARLAVDFWRNVYTLNYEVLRLPGSGAIPGLAEPSVSLWVPSPPVV